MRTVLLVSALAVVLGSSSCGGDDAAFTRAAVEEEMTTVIESGGGSMWKPVDDVACEKQADDLHWTCTTTIAALGDPADRSTLSVSTLCVEETGRCHRIASSVYATR